MLTGVSAVWDAEANLKVKRFEQEILEKMPLDQTKAVQCLAAHCELQPERQVTDQLKETLVRKHLIHGPTGTTFDGLIHIDRNPTICLFAAKQVTDCRFRYDKDDTFSPVFPFPHIPGTFVVAILITFSPVSIPSEC